jgi:MFS family permease
MLGSYVLSFQIYLALPLQLQRTLPHPTAATGALFAISALVTIGAQVRLTDWCRRRWPPGRCLTVGLAIMGAAYVPLALSTGGGPAVTLTAVAAASAMLALGSAMAYPFEMHTIVTLARGQRVATHYGLYHSIAGVGILAGNAGLGALIAHAGPTLPWLVLLAVGAAATIAVYTLDRSGQLTADPPPPVAHAAAR